MSSNTYIILKELTFLFPKISYSRTSLGTPNPSGNVPALPANVMLFSMANAQCIGLPLAETRLMLLPLQEK